MAATGGKSQGVRVVTDAELAANEYEIQPGKVTKVSVLDAAVRGVLGGPALAIYPVTLAEAQRRGVIGGKSIPVADITTSRKVTSDNLALPVYVVSGSLGGVSVCLTWDDNSSDEDGFSVERSPDDSDWTVLTVTAAGIQEYQDDTVLSGNTYYYRVGATKSGFSTSYSASVSISV